MEGVVAVAALAQQDFLAPLSNHAQGGLEHTVNWPQRRGGAGQVQPWKRLGNPICVHGSLDSLNEFLAINSHGYPHEHFVQLPCQFHSRRSSLNTW